jgi:putative SOS response-associated peptidase YedK
MEHRQEKLEKRYEGVAPMPYIERRRKDQLEIFNYYHVSGFTHPQMVVVSHRGLENMSWGLIPYGSADEKIANFTLNARSEEIFETRSYKNLIHHKRCILPITGFFERRHINNKKIPYFIQIPEEDIFSLGCIFDAHQDKTTGKLMNTFSIITTQAVGIMETIHNTKLRMPLILNPDYEAAWLDNTVSKEDIIEMMQPYQGDLKAKTISTEINFSKSDRNKWDILNEVRYPDVPAL